ncbi:MAG: flippase-like domain-containing protein [Clostridiales bacterium]|nr:flippase-like domain-containing protein [Clostridiales bacterium]
MRDFLHKNWLNLAGALTALGILLWFVFAAPGGGLAALAAALANIRVYWLLCGVLVILLYWFFEALVLQVLTRSLRRGYKFTHSLYTGLVGLFYSAITPFSTGGQPMQLYVMARSGLSAGSAGSILITKSIIYQTCLTVISIAGVLFGASYFYERVPYFAVLVLVGLALNFLAVAAMCAVTRNSGFTHRFVNRAVALLHRIRLVRRPERLLDKIHRQMAIFHKSAGLFEKNARVRVLSYALTSLQFLSYYTVPFCVYKSLGFSGASIFLMLYAQSIITMITAFIPLPGSSGAAEGSFYLFFSLFFNAAAIMPAILLWRFLTYYLSILTGGLLWIARFARPTAPRP